MSSISTSAHESYEKNVSTDPRERAPLVTGGRNFHDVTEMVDGLTHGWPTIWWWGAFMFSNLLLAIFGGLIGYLIVTGTGIWGNNQPAAWGFPIVNFVFWVGIGHAGTLISAVLFLFRQNWRTGINRFAEAMTIFAVMCAATFPGIHVGRPWLAYWLFPIPNQMDMWPQFRSPLLWDVFAVGTYATVSTLFWYTGMVPDFATLRDRAKNVVAKIGYSVVSLGWTGSSRHWHRFEKAYLLLAALATPLVLSVHSVVSFDFAVAQLPGWHTTIFPPYFVAGAIYGGFAMVITLAVPCRKMFGLEDIITWRHVQNMAKVMLGTGMIVSYAYAIEFFIAWYGAVSWEVFAFQNRAFGPYKTYFFLMVFCNCIGPQILWFKWARNNVWTIMFAAMCVNVGMWFERFVIIVTSLVRDYLPSSWDLFVPTWVDIWMFIGSFGLFFTMFLLFLKFLPTCAMAEIKSVMPEAHAHSGPGGESMGSEGRSDYQPDA
ncbi:NrfD/PsrC family molybdoenzyme membrane anchor subunit [Poriferisphaera sp. WC338]|uniref:NrfD/PsrC family molybdoenzyme membrane anchor subunit n=1 Tax=Poriferisphaera sp. WC338 TaxID=3425129 RepID=UPI003D81B958